MGEIFKLIFFLSTRFFLHLFTSASIYFIIKNYVPISKTTFLLVILPLVVLLEYYQYIHQFSDSVSGIVLLRDSVEVLLIVIVFTLLYIFRRAVSLNFLIFSIATLLILLLAISVFVEGHKPAGQHLLYKSFIDILAYGFGPFIIYPILTKIFKF